VRRQAKRDAALDFSVKPLNEILKRTRSPKQGGVALRLPPHSTHVLFLLKLPVVSAPFPALFCRRHMGNGR